MSEKNKDKKSKWACLGNCKEWNNIPSQWHEDLKNIDTTIKQLPNYQWVKDKYEPLRNDYFYKIGLSIK